MRLSPHRSRGKIPMIINDDVSIKEILNSVKNQGKMVNIVLNNGKSYKGMIAQVGMYHVRLERKDELSFYDAFINIDHISSIEVQVRG
jgi:sRNA-binding regulator protein Hfq